MRKIILSSVIIMFLLLSVGCFSFHKNSGELICEVSEKSLDKRREAYKQLSGERDYINKLSMISSKFAANVISENQDFDKNLVCSPISYYLAMSMLYEVGDENVKNNIKSVFNISDDDLSDSTYIMDYLCFEISEKNKILSALNLTNSIWIDDNLTPIPSAAESLSKKYYCYSYKTPFRNNNKVANESIRAFIKEQTKGLIDNNFNLDDDILFCLINTLYMKDSWLEGSRELSVGKYQCFDHLNNTISRELMIGLYNSGKEYYEDDFHSFFTTTSNRFKLSFIVPMKDDLSVYDVMTEENINKVNLMKYETRDEVAKLKYNTRCIFPEFEADSFIDLSDITSKNLGITAPFMPYIPSIINQEVTTASIIQQAKLKVNRKGMEGAAVTIIADKATSVGPDEYEEVYYDFVVNKGFGYIISYNDVILFSGVVNKF